MSNLQVLQKIVVQPGAVPVRVVYAAQAGRPAPVPITTVTHARYMQQQDPVVGAQNIGANAGGYLPQTPLVPVDADPSIDRKIDQIKIGAGGAGQGYLSIWTLNDAGDLWTFKSILPVTATGAGLLVLNAPADFAAIPVGPNDHVRLENETGPVFTFNGSGNIQTDGFYNLVGENGQNSGTAGVEAGGLGAAIGWAISLNIATTTTTTVPSPDSTGSVSTNIRAGARARLRASLMATITMGQSLASGYEAAPLTVTQSYDDVVVAPHPSTNSTALLPATAVNGTAANNEAPMFSYYFKSLLVSENGIAHAVGDHTSPEDYQSVGGNCGVPGVAISGLVKGTTPYTEYLRMIRGIKAIATAAGRTTGVRAVRMIQGHADEATPFVDYKAALRGLANDVIADAKAETGQLFAPHFITYQCSSDGSGSAPRNVAEAQLQLALEHPEIFMACPDYMLPVRPDGTHPTSIGSRTLNCYLDIAEKRIEIDQVDFEPLRPVGILITGLSVTLIYNRTGLVFDGTGVIPTQTNQGFNVTDASGAEVAISNVQIIGSASDRVRFDVASTPAKDWSFNYGTKTVGSATGGARTDGSTGRYGGGNLRDSQGLTMVSPDGVPLHNWAVVSRYRI